MNKQKNKVESKYKNPDKFINKLKFELKRKDRVMDARDSEISRLIKEKESIKTNAYGKRWFTYKDPGHEMGVNLAGHDAIIQLDHLPLGTTIVCFGKVVEIIRGIKKNEASMLINDVYLKRSECHDK